jgi:cytochrome P450
MSEPGDASRRGKIVSLDRERLRRVFDLRSDAHSGSVAGYMEDPYPMWHRLRQETPVHPGTLHDLTGFHGPVTFQGFPFEDRPHFTAFTFHACDEALRDESTFASSPVPVDMDHGDLAPLNSLLTMGGSQHRRYRALVQPSFAQSRMPWWVDRWIAQAADAVIDSFVADGRAELSSQFCAAIPVLTITGSFGVDVDQAIDLREVLGTPQKLLPMLEPIVAARRESSCDDLISVLVDSEVTDEGGQMHRLSDAEIYSFALLLLLAGSGTTWRQMGITLAALLARAELLEQVRQDPDLLRRAIDESVRWAPTNPMFSRFLTRDLDFYGQHLPKGAVLHLALGAGSRDPARWDRPDEYDPSRPPRPSLGFGGGPHICLGVHLARTQMQVAIEALLRRLPNLRLDEDRPAPRIIVPPGPGFSAGAIRLKGSGGSGRTAPPAAMAVRLERRELSIRWAP